MRLPHETLHWNDSWLSENLQGLKPNDFAVSIGTTKVVPFQDRPMGQLRVPQQESVSHRRSTARTQA